MKRTFEFNGREVTNPFAKALVAAVVVLWGGASLVVGLVGLAISVLALVITIPLSVPLHFLLRALGRRGFFAWDGRSFEWFIGAGSFRRR